MMRLTATILILLSVGCFTACKKGDAIPTVTATVNGVPAVTLYGTTNEPVDYVLLSTSGNQYVLSYGGVVYVYIHDPSNGLYVVISPSYGVAGTIDTVNNKTVVQFNVPYNPFASQVYTSR